MQRCYCRPSKCTSYDKPRDDIDVLAETGSLMSLKLYISRQDGVSVPPAQKKRYESKVSIAVQGQPQHREDASRFHSKMFITN